MYMYILKIRKFLLYCFKNQVENEPFRFLSKITLN